MALRRRKVLLVGAVVVFQAVIAGCTRAGSMIGEIRRAARMSAPTPQELELLRNIKARRTALGNKQLVIAGRLFDAETRLEDFELENTLFKDCDFEGCTMLQGVLRNVSFDNCRFISNVWEKGPWDNVSFSGCAWRGRFKMGSAALKGDLRFDDCEFIGYTPKEMGYGGPADTFGAVGANNGNVFYKNCRFAHTYIHGGALLNIKSSILDDCKLLAATGARLLVEGVTGSGLIDIEGGRDVVFSSVVVRDSKFSGALSFEDVQIGSGTFERLTADLTLEASRADTIDMRNVTFFSKDGANPGYRTGLDTRSAKIRILNILDCDFRGPAATLCLGGLQNIDLNKKTPTETMFLPMAMRLL